MPTPESNRRRYYTLKSDQKCASCGGELAADDGIRCATCTEVVAPTQELYRLSEHGRAVRVKAQRSFHTRRYDAGLCVVCATHYEQWPPPTPAQAASAARRGKRPQRCSDCALEHMEYRRRAKALARQGVISLAAARRRRSREERITAAVQRRAELERQISAYQPVDEHSTKHELLRALRFFEWITAAELFDVVGVELEDKTARDRYAAALSRLARAGELVERRKVKGGGVRGHDAHAEYRLTARGRTELG